ncbi:MAG: nucleoside deaminase [Planctomycetota bacterium]
MALSDADRPFVAIALDEARQGLCEGGVPIGACLAEPGQVLGRGHNRRMQLGCPIRHGEMDALQHAGRLPAATYRRATMYTTLSPCAMCSGAILLYGIPRVVIAENTTFRGEEDLLRQRGVEVVVLDLDEAKELMTRFRARHPEIWNEDIGAP